MRIKIYITPRAGILDPQGRAVENSLRSLGFDSVRGVHIGRYIVVELDALSSEAAEASVREMCTQLLANPLIEDYRFEVDAG